MKRIKQLLETLKKPDWYFPIVIVAIVAVFAGVLGSVMLRGEAVEKIPTVKIDTIRDTTMVYNCESDLMKLLKKHDSIGTYKFELFEEMQLIEKQIDSIKMIEVER